MFNFFIRIRKIFILRATKNNGVKVLCAIVFVISICTAFILNAFALFRDSPMMYINTSAADAKIAMREAGLLAPPDEIESGSVFAQEDGDDFPDLSVPEGFRIHIHADNRMIEMVSAGETVADIILRSGIVLFSTDVVVPGLATPVTGDTDITVSRIENHTEEVMEPVPFETIRKPSEKISAGESVVVQKGAEGQKRILYEVYTRDGAETLRHPLETNVLAEPVSEIIEYGTGGTVTVSGQAYAYKKALDVTASAYTTENHKWKLTASGTAARVGAIAVDPDVIPMGTKMLITSPDGKSWIYGVAVAEDTGGSIIGNKIDLFFNTRAECMQFGIKKAKVYILD